MCIVHKCNLVGQNKCNQWTLEDNCFPLTHNKGYIFASQDPEDTEKGSPLIISKKNYSDEFAVILHDDAPLIIKQRISKNTLTRDPPEQRQEALHELITAARTVIKCTGDFLLV